jgi:hypothetical protein
MLIHTPMKTNLLTNKEAIKQVSLYEIPIESSLETDGCTIGQPRQFCVLVDEIRKRPIAHRYSEQYCMLRNHKVFQFLRTLQNVYKRQLHSYCLRSCLFSNYYQLLIVGVMEYGILRSSKTSLVSLA